MAFIPYDGVDSSVEGSDSSNKAVNLSAMRALSNEFLLLDIITQLKLLNARVEEAFETGIEEADIDGSYNWN